MPLMPPGWKIDRDRGVYTDPATRREYVSVTTALKEAGCMSIQFPDSSFRAMWRGTQVHKFVADTLTLPPERTNTAERFEALGQVEGHGFAAGFFRFQREVPFETLEIDGRKVVERGVVEPTYGFAGQLDFAAIIAGRLAVVDIKTGAPYRWHGLQLAGYSLGLFGSQFENARRFGLYLRKDGTYKLKPYEEDELERTVFLSAVALSRWKMKLAA